MTFDLLCSEYGWSKEYILDQVTPAQAELLTQAIAARRRAELVREMGLIRLAVWGDGHQVDEMQRMLLAPQEREDAQALAAMGITVTRRSRSGHGRDDGQPAG